MSLPSARMRVRTAASPVRAAPNLRGETCQAGRVSSSCAAVSLCASLLDRRHLLAVCRWRTGDITREIVRSDRIGIAHSPPRAGPRCLNDRLSVIGELRIRGHEWRFAGTTTELSAGLAWRLGSFQSDVRHRARATAGSRATGWPRRGLRRVEAERRLAEGEGFEPPIPFRVQRFSRPPPSTARPSLRA